MELVVSCVEKLVGSCVDGWSVWYSRSKLARGEEWEEEVTAASHHSYDD